MARILIVDDNYDEAETMARLLELSAMKRSPRPMAAKALAHVIGQKLPDVILLDLIMPEMDGQHFLEVLRSYLRLTARLCS